MNIESIREYCLGLPHATEDMAFGEEYILFRVFDKIFACLDLERCDCIALKCDPEYAIELRGRYPEIQPAWHWNKRYWNQIDVGGSIHVDLIKSLIRHSYSEVVKKMAKKVKSEFPEIIEVF